MASALSPKEKGHTMFKAPVSARVFSVFYVSLTSRVHVFLPLIALYLTNLTDAGHTKQICMLRPLGFGYFYSLEGSIVKKIEAS